jgi:hypothetical protein
MPDTLFVTIRCGSDVIARGCFCPSGQGANGTTAQYLAFKEELLKIL